MNSFEATLIGITTKDGQTIGKISVRGAIQSVSLRLVPDAHPGDILVCDAGVAVSCVSSGHLEEEKNHVSRHSR